ncbi:MAG: BRcat domain-containing protein [Coprobacillaceae bacterium]
MNNFKNSLYRFMYGRYGSDALNNFLMIFTLISLLLNTFFIRNSIVTTILWVLIIFYMFRMYSKNIMQRRKENEMFLQLTRPIRKRFSLFQKQRNDSQNKYFLCPSCQQIVRVPKGRGAITITCPSCKNKFDKKS